MGKVKNYLGWVLTAAISFGAAQAHACAFHGYTPDPTLVNVLLESEQAVVAQVSPSGQYQPVKTLMGPTYSDIPVSIDPVTRARLAADPSLTVLLARDGSYGPWMELAVLDKGFRKVVDRVVKRQSDWQLGDEQDRLRYFAKHLNDPNPDIRHLALRELDRVPYSVLKSVRLPKVKALSQDLQTGSKDLMPIRVLLAGLSKDRQYSGFLSVMMDMSIATKDTYLGAYATALIELEGEPAVAEISKRISAKSVSRTVQDKLLQAFAIQYRSATDATRRAIAQEVTELARKSPDLKDAVAQQFGLNERWVPTE